MGVFPLDGDYGKYPSWNKTDMAHKIGEINEELMSSCDAIIANITPFRGATADSGTVYEIGYMSGQGKPVLAYSNENGTLATRTKKLLEIPNADQTDQNGMIIEDFGLVDNLMIDGAVHRSGFRVTMFHTSQEDRFENLLGFEQCVIKLAKAVNRK